MRRQTFHLASAKRAAADAPCFAAGRAILPGRKRGLVVAGAHPVDANAGAAAKNQRQLARVMLNVAKVVQQELADVQLVPPEPATLEDPFVGQLPKGRNALLQAVIGVEPATY